MCRHEHYYRARVRSPALLCHLPRIADQSVGTVTLYITILHAFLNSLVKAVVNRHINYDRREYNTRSHLLPNLLLVLDPFRRDGVSVLLNRFD